MIPNLLERNPNISDVSFAVCNCFGLDWFKIFLVWERVNSLSIKQQNLRLVLIQRINFADDKINVDIEVKFGLGWKTLWKEEKLLVTSIFYFPTIFSKAFCFKVVKSQDCVVKS